MNHCPLHHVTYVPAKFKVSTANSLGDAFKRKYIIWHLTLTQRSRSQGHIKCCPVPSTSCDLFTSKVKCCYISQLRISCIYKKTHWPWSWGQGHTQEMLPSIVYIMWPMHLQSLKLLCQMVKEGMQLQENKLFDLWPSRGQGHTKC